MSYLLSIFIFYVFFHWYFQNVLVPGMLASKKIKILELEQQIETLNSTKLISSHLYIAFKLLFRTTESILDSSNGIDVYSQENNNNKNKSDGRKVGEANSDFSAWVNQTKSEEVARILHQWEVCMKEAYKVSFYAWYAYLFPLIIFDKLLGTVNHRKFNAWLKNIQPYREISSTI